MRSNADELRALRREIARLRNVLYRIENHLRALAMLRLADDAGNIASRGGRVRSRN